MKESFKKIDKEFCITDNSVNSHEYRCLTSGFQLKEVVKNPIGYFNHGTSEYPRGAGVLVRWDDFRISSEKVFAKPIINISHPRGIRTINEIETGFLNAASVGKIVVLETSTDQNLMLPGQTKPTITKWFPREISIVDIYGDYNGFANLIDENDNKYNLAQIIIQTKQDHENSNIEKSKILKIIGLSNGTESEILFYIDDLVKSSKRVSQLETELFNLKDFNQYEDKTFDELYSADKLEFVRNKYPALYEKIKNQKYPNLKV